MEELIRGDEERKEQLRRRIGVAFTAEQLEKEVQLAIASIQTIQISVMCIVMRSCEVDNILLSSHIQNQAQNNLHTSSPTVTSKLSYTQEHSLILCRNVDSAKLLFDTAKTKGFADVHVYPPYLTTNHHPSHKQGIEKPGAVRNMINSTRYRIEGLHNHGLL